MTEEKLLHYKALVCDFVELTKQIVSTLPHDTSGEDAELEHELDLLNFLMCGIVGATISSEKSEIAFNSLGEQDV